MDDGNNVLIMILPLCSYLVLSFYASGGQVHLYTHASEDWKQFAKYAALPPRPYCI